MWSQWPTEGFFGRGRVICHVHWCQKLWSFSTCRQRYDLGAVQTRCGFYVIVIILVTVDLFSTTCEKLPKSWTWRVFCLKWKYSVSNPSFVVGYVACQKKLYVMDKPLSVRSSIGRSHRQVGDRIGAVQWKLQNTFVLVTFCTKKSAA